MKLTNTPDFIIIDDDPINNMICNKIIAMTIPGATIKTFTDAENGLKHIMSTYSPIDSGNAILLLDINMPFLSGWETLDRMSDFPDLVKEHIKIFMLSSSIDPLDHEKANNNALVSGYIAKALSQSKLQAILPV
jgi:CheY-like chemotaxis protein